VKLFSKKKNKRIGFHFSEIIELIESIFFMGVFDMTPLLNSGP
jgi:hypothetical protein